MEVTGHPSVTLYISIDVPDAAIFVYLEEVRVGGRVVYITEGQLRWLDLAFLSVSCLCVMLVCHACVCVMSCVVCVIPFLFGARLSHRATAAREPYPSPVPYRSYTSAEQSLLEAGKPYRVVIPMFPCSYQFSLGSRIRLSIASADIDNFDPIPGPAPSTFTIFYDHSYLNLPEVRFPPL